MNKRIISVFFILLFISSFSKCGLAKTTNKKKYNLKFALQNIPENYISPNQYNINVLSYKLNIDLHPSKKILNGDVLIKGVILDKQLKQIDLNFYDNMKISQLTLNNMKVGYSDENTRLTIPITEMCPDTFLIRIVYSGTPKREGFSSFVFGELNGKSCVYNLSEPIYASTWFPCNDIPTDKALVEMNITNDSSEVSVSNGVLIGISTNGTRRTYHWKSNYPIATYLVCLYSSDYKTFSQKYISLDSKDTMAIDYYVFPNQVDEAKIDFEDHPDMLHFFSKTFGEYPFIKEKYGVTEFLWQLGAMETQTMTAVGFNLISGQKLYTEIYSHELSHHWFGDAVTPKTWKDIWLNEGFASYCEALYNEHIGGFNALRSTMLSKLQNNYNGTVYNPNDLFGQTVYQKGAWVLHMLRHDVGDTTFFQILRKYFDLYKYKNASTEDFENVCEAVSGKDLHQFFKQWVYEGTGKIRAAYSWKIDGKNLIINFSQIQKGYYTYQFPLDIQIKYFDNSEVLKTVYIDKKEKSFTIKLNKVISDIKVDPENWILGEFEYHKENN